MKENEGNLDFLALVVKFGCWGEKLPPLLYKCGGWGDDSGAEFLFLREQSERTECYLW